MPFRFTYLCDLFQQLEDHCTRDPPLPPPHLKSLIDRTVRQWFQSHRARLDALDASGAAFLSACFPERRTDRVYNIREKSLVKILGRVLGLPIARRKTLEEWCKPGRGDLGACVARVQREAEMAIPLAGNEVTLEEIDAVFAALASRCRFSSPAVRQSTARDCHENPDGLLRPLFHRLRSRDAKWLTRMLLKNYAPVIIPEHLVLTQYHFLLPELLKFQSNFDAAVALLRGPVIATRSMHPQEEGERERVRQAILQQLTPKVGVKVGRTAFFKARSVKHCLEMVGQQRMSLERKYDGEYCQIHVDLTRKENWLQIFSKSGKDSTADRRGIHQTIRECLRIGKPDRAFSEKCILEGELVVYSDKDNEILEFHKLRKHVSRSGSFLGTERDSQPHEHEHLMIVFYDILLLDDKAVLTKNYNERKGFLEDVALQIPGRAELAWRKQISFRSSNAAARLRETFARGIRLRWEGFVLKPIDQPYFGLGLNQTGYWIKLKKDYIKGLGDTADFAVIGAGFGAGSIRAKDRDLPWTHFHLGCLQNKEEVLRFGVKPRWKVIQSVSECINKEDLKTLNHLGQFRSLAFDGQTMFEEFDLTMDLSQDECRMNVVFRQPFVFDVMGGGFVKPPGKRFYTLRWPRVEKIHWDRSWTDSISFEELQKMASEAVTAPDSGASQEELAWIEKLEEADMGRRRTDAMRADSSWQAAEASEGRDRHGMDTTQSTSSSSGPSTNADTNADTTEARASGSPVEATRPGQLISVLRSEASTALFPSNAGTAGGGATAPPVHGRPPLPTPPSSDPALGSKVTALTKSPSSVGTAMVQKEQKGREDDVISKSAEAMHNTSTQQRKAVDSVGTSLQAKMRKPSIAKASSSNEAATVQKSKSAEETAESGGMTHDTSSKKRKAEDADDVSLQTKKRRAPSSRASSSSEYATMQIRKEDDKMARSAQTVQNTSPKKRKAAGSDDTSLKTKMTKVVSTVQHDQALMRRVGQSAQANSSATPIFWKPLADITNSPSHRAGHKSMASPDSPSRPNPASAKEHIKGTTLQTMAHQPTTAPTQHMSSDQENPGAGTAMPSSSSATIPPAPLTNGVLRPTCTLKGARCKLANAIALLSPCVAQMPYITEDMLPAHGISFTRDADDLVNINNRDKQKIVLVETHRADPTADTIEQITMLDLPRMDVVVYDWRVLECLAKEERDGEGSLGFDGWGRCFVCAI